MNDEQRRGLQELSDWVASLDRGAPGSSDPPDRAPTAHALMSLGGARAMSSEADEADEAAATDEQPLTVASDGSANHDEPDRPDASGDGNGDERGRRRGRKERSAARTLFDWVLVVGVALLVAVVIRTFVLAHFVVDGTSMASTLDDGDRVFVNKLSYRFGDPSRGDVAVLHQFDGARDLIKRVIGLEGETIDVRNCQVFIDGRPLEEPYLDPDLVGPGRCGNEVEGVLIPDDHVFVMGDNRDGSQDSRNLGPVHEDDLVGRAFVVFWPGGNWKWL